MSTKPSDPDPDRRTGRTTEILQWCLDAVLEGQPKCVIVGATTSHVISLRWMFLDLLHERIPSANWDRRARRIIFEESEIAFISTAEYVRFVEGTRGWGEFWDHYAEETCPHHILDYSYARLRREGITT